MQYNTIQYIANIYHTCRQCVFLDLDISTLNCCYEGGEGVLQLQIPTIHYTQNHSIHLYFAFGIIVLLIPDLIFTLLTTTCERKHSTLLMLHCPNHHRTHEIALYNVRYAVAHTVRPLREILCGETFRAAGAAGGGFATHRTPLPTTTETKQLVHITIAPRQRWFIHLSRLPSTPTHSLLQVSSSSRLVSIPSL